MLYRLAQIGLSLIGIIVALIPTLIYLWTRVLISPEGFWQELMLLAISVLFLGGIQLLFIVFLLGWLCFVWESR